MISSTVPYMANVYTREPSKLLFALNGEEVEIVKSARRVEYGCNLGPLCCSTGPLEILKEFKPQSSMLGGIVVSFIDYMTHFATELFLDIATIGRVTKWLHKRLGLEGIPKRR